MSRKEKVSIGVIGYGHWGPNYVRNFALNPETMVKTVCDIDEGRLQSLNNIFPEIKTTSDYREIMEDREIQGVVIATPASSHYKLVKEALLADKDVLAEKALCTVKAEAMELASLAEKRGRILTVGHVFRFNNGIEKVREYIQDASLGKIYYIHMTHTNLGPIRPDVNVVWDLAPHGISILFHILNAWPLEVNARGLSIFNNEREDFSFISLKYPQDVHCQIHVSWIDPKKVRRMIIVGEKKMLVWNDVSNNPIEIHDKWVKKETFYRDFGEFQLIPREGPIFIPRISLKEPLKNFCSHFIECVVERKKPLVDGEEAANNIAVIEAINRAMKIEEGGIEIAYS